MYNKITNSLLKKILTINIVILGISLSFILYMYFSNLNNLENIFISNTTNITDKLINQNEYSSDFLSQESNEKIIQDNLLINKNNFNFLDSYIVVMKDNTYSYQYHHTESDVDAVSGATATNKSKGTLVPEEFSNTNSAIYKSWNDKTLHIQKTYKDKRMNFVFSYPVINNTNEVSHLLVFEVDGQSYLQNKNDMLLKLIILIISLIIISTLLNILFVRKITKPILKINELMKQTSQKDFNVETIEDIPNDEIGELITSFYSLINSFKDTLYLLRTSENDLTGTNSNLDTIISNTLLQLKSLNDDTFILTEKIKNISDNVFNISKSIEEVNADSQKIRTNCDIMQEKTNSTLHNTQENITKIKLVNNDIDYMSNAMKQVVHKNELLTQSTTKIIENIKRLNEINKEINLLSLNASIESARAGEHGKGFSVIAKEIKNLSDASQIFTKDINTIINEIANNTNGLSVDIDETSKIVTKTKDYSLSIEKDFEVIMENLDLYKEDLIHIFGNINSFTTSISSIKDNVENVNHNILEINDKSKNIKDSLQKETLLIDEIKNEKEILNTNKENISNLIKEFNI